MCYDFVIQPASPPDWGQAAAIAFQTIFPHLAVLLLLQDIERLKDLALSQGFDIRSFQVQDMSLQLAAIANTVE